MTDYEFTAKPKFDIPAASQLSAWETYRNHREIVTRFILDFASPEAQTLCVLGAGHCRDIDLNELLNRFSSITLVDLVQSDMSRGVEDQRLTAGNRIKLTGNFDVGGVHELLQQYRRNADHVWLDSILKEAAKYQPDGLGHYDVIASTCLLSQLLFHATECVGESHHQFVDMLQTIRRHHIEIMLDRLNSGGTGLLITDFVSSVSLPELLTTSNLKLTLQEAIDQGNFLHGLNPAMVGGVFNESQIRDELRSIRITDPWRWVMPERVYACFAIVFQKK